MNINLYADDIYITIFAENDTLLTYYLQYYMDKLKKWFDINKLKLNIEKNKNIVIYKFCYIKRYKHI